MKKLTLDETWRLCLSMWKWIAKQKREGSKKTPVQLKYQWMSAHGLEEKINADCFFCNYITANKKCDIYCPGVKIDKDFNCATSGCHWYHDPIAFYNKLVSLNRKRLAKKRG
ncbi:hypothetical protein LCGC14_2801350 [marine sediment metagenome]|uniref:Uncharacterized protein n=1 Tax=marine sediment metagenome TaxID=412755 RepID=A0A0F8YMJ8_9ZZZZ